MSTTIPHGNYTRYCRYGCRCGPCTASQREYMRRYRRTVRLKPVEVIPHGVNGYENYSCRCDVCQEAKYRKTAAWYLRKADEIAAGP